MGKLVDLEEYKRKKANEVVCSGWLEDELYIAAVETITEYYNKLLHEMEEYTFRDDDPKDVS